ncbi:hypothetical protein Rcae01_03895 [Novipirellula caenicola]|uniref:Uncharacterized protein n=1 Tax=Novipirellula caenicola TaxID=1536901 RepID=A0ABP9VTF9_9BACT
MGANVVVDPTGVLVIAECGCNGMKIAGCESGRVQCDASVHFRARYKLLLLVYGCS